MRVGVKIFPVSLFELLSWAEQLLPYQEINKLTTHFYTYYFVWQFLIKLERCCRREAVIMKIKLWGEKLKKVLIYYFVNRTIGGNYAVNLVLRKMKF